MHIYVYMCVCGGGGWCACVCARVSLRVCVCCSMANMCKDGNFDKRSKGAHPIDMMKDAEHAALESVTPGQTNQITVRFWMRVYFDCYGRPIRMLKVARNCEAFCAVCCAVLRMRNRRQTRYIFAPCVSPGYYTHERGYHHRCNYAPPAFSTGSII